jgi:hypothetical protein
MKSFRRIISLLVIFSVAMGFFEAAVVIYLRQLYYPEGFKFPLSTISSGIAAVELLREAATIIMLLTIGIIAGKNFVQRFSFFIFCFGVWDIFYYVFLKLFLDWPASLFTWDILFLIPVPWIGPVIAPCILSVTMITLSMILLNYSERAIHLTVNKKEWALFIVGALIVILSFTLDYVPYLLINKQSSFWTPLSKKEVFNDITGYVPESFNWFVFISGELVLIAAIALLMSRHHKLSKT